MKRSSFGTTLAITLLGLMASLGPAACGDDEGDGAGGSGNAGTGGLVDTGASCEVAADCYPGIADDINGEILCLDRVKGGYCTHLCETDDDCCAVAGECETNLVEVCSPFESTGQMMCFLSCEDDDLTPAEGQSGPIDPEEFCQREAGPEFICRSSGGGANNRKICVPGDCGIGAECGSQADCAGDLECVLAFDGGYCTSGTCTANADCPADSLCVDHSDGQSYCLKTCDAESDCTFCRTSLLHASCRDDVGFAEAGTTGEVCVPD